MTSTMTIYTKSGNFNFDLDNLEHNPKKLAKAFNYLATQAHWNGNFKSVSLTGQSQLATLQVVLNRLEKLYSEKNSDLPLKRYAKCLVRATNLTSFDKQTQLTSALNEVGSLPLHDILKVAIVVRNNAVPLKKAFGKLPNDGAIVTSAGSTPCNLLLLFSHMNRVPVEESSKTPLKSVPLDMDADLVPLFLQFMEGTFDDNLDDLLLMRLCACATTNNLPLLSVKCGETIYKRIPSGRIKISSDNVHLLLQTKQTEIINVCCRWFEENYKNKLYLDFRNCRVTVKVLSSSADSVILNRIIPGVDAVCFSDYSAFESFVAKMKSSPSITFDLKRLILSFDRDIVILNEDAKVLATCFPSLQSLEIHSKIEPEALNQFLALKSLKNLNIHHYKDWRSCSISDALNKKKWRLDLNDDELIARNYSY